jgi:hypothetical protein
MLSDLTLDRLSIEIEAKTSELLTEIRKQTTLGKSGAGVDAHPAESLMDVCKEFLRRFAEL